MSGIDEFVMVIINSPHYRHNFSCKKYRDMNRRTLINDFQIRKAILLLVAVFICSYMAAAISVDGISYELNANGTAVVTDVKDLVKTLGDDCNIVIPQTITYDNQTYEVVGLASKSFMLCKEIKTIKLPETITTFGDTVFIGCVNLLSINIPSGLKKVGNHIFRWDNSSYTITLRSMNCEKIAHPLYQ